MTDAPNSVSEFGWRKPHPRRTPPYPALLRSLCRGRAPSRPVGEMFVFHAAFRYLRNVSRIV